MKKEDLNIILDKILPKIYRFSIIVSADKLLAQQNIVDAITVFLLENKDFLKTEIFELKEGKDRISLSKYLLRELSIEIYHLNQKKAVITQGISAGFTPEYEDFNKLTCQERVVLYLKESEDFTIQDLQELLSLKYHDVIQIFYNAKNKLMKKQFIENPLVTYDELESSSQIHLANTLVYETYQAGQRELIEKRLHYTPSLNEYLQIKQNERDFFKQLIPEIKLKKSDLVEIRREVISIITEIIPYEEESFLGKFKRILDRPIISIDL